MTDNKELLRYVENNEEQIETEEVIGNTKQFLDQITKGLKIYGVWVDNYTRVHKSDKGQRVTEAPVLETIDGMIVLPDHQRILDAFEELELGDLVIVSCTDIKYKDKDGEKVPAYYYWKVERVNTQKLQKKQ